jgi:hypothetical protein
MSMFPLLQVAARKRMQAAQLQVTLPTGGVGACTAVGVPQPARPNLPRQQHPSQDLQVTPLLLV